MGRPAPYMATPSPSVCECEWVNEANCKALCHVRYKSAVYIYPCVRRLRIMLEILKIKSYVDFVFPLKHAKKVMVGKK